MGQRQRLAGDFAVAEAVLLETIDRVVAAKGSPVLLVSLYNELCVLHQDLDRYAEALESGRTALGLARTLNPDTTSTNQTILFNVAYSEAMVGEYDAARTTLTHLVDVAFGAGKGSLRLRTRTLQTLEFVERESGNTAAADAVRARVEQIDPERKHRFSNPLTRPGSGPAPRKP